MSINRTAIYNALHARLTSIEGAGCVELGLRHIDNVQAEEMPYVGMFIPQQQRVSGTGHLPGKYTLPCQLFVYVSRKDTDVHALHLLNDFLDAIDRALEVPHNWPSDTLTSAPHVVHMRVEGTIELDSAPMGETAMAVVPVVIVAAG